MDDRFDALTGGITVFGMRSKGDIRILLCYILKSLDTAFSKSGLNEVLQSTALANFFEVNDALSVLLEDGLIIAEKRENDEYYTLTPRGREIAGRMETDLPSVVRRTAVASAQALLSRERAARGANAEIKRLDRGYHVRLTVMEGDTLMMETVLYAADSIQANAIADSFMAAPGNLYSGIIESLKL